MLNETISHKVVVQCSAANGLVEDEVADLDGGLVEGIVTDAQVEQDKQAVDGADARRAGQAMQVLFKNFFAVGRNLKLPGWSL